MESSVHVCKMLLIALVLGSLALSAASEIEQDAEWNNPFPLEPCHGVDLKDVTVADLNKVGPVLDLYIPHTLD